MALRPIQSACQIFPSLRLVQPEFVFRHNKCRADQPYPRLSFFNKNLPSSELFAKRNLSIRADDLDAGLASYVFHFNSVLAQSNPRPHARYDKGSALTRHDGTIARRPRPGMSACDCGITELLSCRS